MNAIDFLQQLRSAGVNVSILDDRLTFDAPAGVLTAEMKAGIVARKPELLAVLTRPRLGSLANPFRVHGQMPKECFFDEVCDGQILRDHEFYICFKCSCWFVEV